MAEQLPQKVYEGEVLPPQEAHAPGLPGLPPGTPLGVPMFARAKYQARTAAFRAYIEFRQAQHELVELDTSIIGAVQNRLAAEERLTSALLRQRHLDKILLADEAALLAELDDVFQGIADKKANTAFERRVTRANLEVSALEAEARLERLKNPPPPRVDPDAGLTRAERTKREIDRVTKDRNELRALLIEAAGGEGNLTEDDRARLDTLELAFENQIQEVMGSF